MRWPLMFLIAAACGDDAATGEGAARDDAAGSGRDAAAPFTGLALRGTNLSGAEFGNGGMFGQSYTYPDQTYGYTSADYFVAKGMTAFRLPFAWERLQPTLNGPFDAAEHDRLKTTVEHLRAKGAKVILDPHNYARYGGKVIGTADVPNAAFADLWTRLADDFKGDPGVVFGLMNEPHGMPTEQWRDAANVAIAAIRATGATNLITVPGVAYTGVHSWLSDSYGTPNGVALLSIVDSGDNYAFEGHQYLDSDYSGTHPECRSATIGAEVFAGFTAWLRTNHKRAFIGEIGAGANATCLTALDGVFDHVAANDDVYLGWTWWSAGPWWGDSYFMNLEPKAGSDVPQMAVVADHL